MQIVAPVDVEDAIREDVGALVAAKCCAPPAPDDLRPNTVCFTSLGGRAQTEVSHIYRISVDCWASTDAEAVALACEVAGIVSSLPVRKLAHEWKTSSLNATPYLNPDPLRPTLPRATFAADVSLRGAYIGF